jgi:hypothetical protein
LWRSRFSAVLFTVCALQYRTPCGTNLLQPFLLQYFNNAILFFRTSGHKNKAAVFFLENAAFKSLVFEL